MKWTIRQISDSPEGMLIFDEKLKIEKELTSRDDRIISVESASAKGYLAAFGSEVLLHADAEVALTLPSTRSLNPVEVRVNFPIRERYVYPEADSDDQEHSVETIIVLDKDYIDLSEAVVDGTLVNLPMKVLSPEELDGELPSGQDWEVITEADYERLKAEEEETTVDPRFAKLQTLFNESNDEA